MNGFGLRYGARPREDGQRQKLEVTRILRGVSAGLCLVAVLASAGWAQEHRPPRIDPGNPPSSPGGSDEGWQVLSIPGLPANAQLGDVWAAPSGDVYVWASYPARVRALDEPGDGERLPNPGASNPRSSTLYRYDGLSWTALLTTPSETAGALLGLDPTDLVASTTSPSGETLLYRFDGRAWTREVVPTTNTGPQQAFAGVNGDLWFRVGGSILHDAGQGMQIAYEMPRADAAARGLVYLDADCVMMLCPDGHVLFDGGAYTDAPAGFTFGDVEDAWGLRDAQGSLHLYALGSTAKDTGVRLWRFNETDPLTHAGTWSAALSDPPAAGEPNLGCGNRIWGAAGNDVYATGVVAGEGRIYRYDGSVWTKLVPPVALAAVHGVWGTDRGAVWFTTSDGRLIRYQRANQAPDVTHARPSVDRLWPDDLRMVPVDLLGIVDPDGDALSVRVTRVTQDEDPATSLAYGPCPDAVLNGAQVQLRAEHAENGNGRTYSVEFTATDRLGATSSGLVRVCAPHYITSPCEDDPGIFDSMGPCAAAPAGFESLEAREVAGRLEIRYTLAQATRIHLGVYDLAGRLRATVAAGLWAPGAHHTTLERGALEPGVYFVKLRAGAPAFTRRVILLR